MNEARKVSKVVCQNLSWKTSLSTINKVPSSIFLSCVFVTVLIIVYLYYIITKRPFRRKFKKHYNEGLKIHKKNNHTFLLYLEKEICLTYFQVLFLENLMFFYWKRKENMIILYLITHYRGKMAEKHIELIEFKTIFFENIVVLYSSTCTDLMSVRFRNFLTDQLYDI